jgi:hypothetical protein
MKTENRKTRMRPAQRDSGNSILWMAKQVIMTVLVKNIMGCFTGKQGNEPMSKMQNVSAQRYSKMSILKIETENSLPQRHSKDNMRGDLPPVVYNIWSAQSTKY